MPRERCDVSLRLCTVTFRQSENISEKTLRKCAMFQGFADDDVEVIVIIENRLLQSSLDFSLKHFFDV